MLELTGLSFKNIGRFIDEQYVDVAALGNFIQVDGENQNTGGSSGSGKTTVFNALDYLFGVNKTPATVLQSRLTKEGMSVTGTFLFNGVPLEITRGKSGIIINRDGKITSGSASKAEEEIDEIIGMPRELFRKIYHKKQKEGGFFLDFAPKQMHEFLAECLKLGEYKIHLTKIDAKITTLIAKINSIESSLSSDNTGLKATQDAILAIGSPPIKEISREIILELKSKFDQASEKQKEVSTRCAEKLANIEQERPNQGIGIYSNLLREGLERRRREIETTISETLSLEKERQGNIKSAIVEKSNKRNAAITQIDACERYKREAAKIAEEVKKIRALQCPTCEQHWADEKSKNSEKSKIAELIQLKTKIDALPSLIKDKEMLDKEIADLTLMLTPVTSPELPILNSELADVVEKLLQEKKKENEHIVYENARIKLLMDTFLVKYNQIRQEIDTELMQVRGQTDLCRKVLDAAVLKMKSYEEAKNRFDASLSKLMSSEEKYRQNIIQLEKDLTNNKNELLLTEELRKAVKTFLSYSFDDALDIISDNATKIIRTIPNMSNATIQFESTKESSDGKIKEEVNAVIGMDGEVGVPIKSLSGGERSAADLAVDLAVIDFIESKTGKGINIFVLDEPFNGLGTVEIEMALEVLKNLNVNKKLIIVDHNPEVKQMVQSRLVVIRNGLTSKVA